MLKRILSHLVVALAMVVCCSLVWACWGACLLDNITYAWGNVTGCDFDDCDMRDSNVVEGNYVLGGRPSTRECAVHICDSNVDKDGYGILSLESDPRLVGTRTEIDKEPDERLTSMILAYAVPEHLQSSWGWRSCLLISKPQETTRRMRTSWRRQIPEPSRVWGEVLWFSSQKSGNCFYDALALSMWGRPCGAAMRHHIAGLWRKSEHSARLHRVASDEGVQAKKYIRKVATSLWGGVPEAHVITVGAPIAIYCWNPMGKLMYSVAEMHDQNQGMVPLHIVHLGYSQKHYVLLQRLPPPRGTSYQEKHACRGGMLRERVRLDPGTRSKAAPPVRDLTDRRPPLRRRRQTGEREDAEGQEPAGHRPIILREPVDDRPPLERRRRPVPVLTPRCDEDVGKGQSDEQDPPSSAVEEQAQPGIAGSHVATGSGAAQSSGTSHQGAEHQTMSDEQYEILAAKRKKILQAAAERQLQAQNARQELEESAPLPTGAAVSLQPHAAAGNRATAGQPMEHL